jgi:hypothetical protein
VIAGGQRLKILLLFNGNDHLLEVVGCDVPFTAAASAVDGILSLNLGMRDIDRCGGGRRSVVGIELKSFFVHK